MVIFIYMSFFIGYFLYFLIKYLNIKENEKDYSSIKEIKSEKFIEDFIESISSKIIFEKILVIIELGLILLSVVIYIFAWIINIIIMIKIKDRNHMWNNN